MTSLVRHSTEQSESELEFFDAESGIERFIEADRALDDSNDSTRASNNRHGSLASHGSFVSRSPSPPSMVSQSPVFFNESSETMSEDSRREIAYSDISCDNSSDGGSASEISHKSSLSREREALPSSGDSGSNIHSTGRDSSNLSNNDSTVAPAKVEGTTSRGNETSSKPNVVGSGEILIQDYAEKVKAPSPPNLNKKEKDFTGPLGFVKRIFGLGLDTSTDNSKNQAFDNIRVKTFRKETADFAGLTKTQTHIKHQAKIWTMKFSRDGSLLASGDSEGVIYVWSVGLHPVEASRSSATRLKEEREAEKRRLAALNIPDNSSASQHEQQSNKFKLLDDTPYKILRGHTKDVVDLSWSPQETKMLLSASVDRTVRLWFIATDTYLVFKHPDIVSCVDFYPCLDVPILFVSGCMDQKIRIWTVPVNDVHPDKDYDEPKDLVNAPEYVTSISFLPDGKMVTAGLTRSQLIFFTYLNDEKGLRFFTQMDLRNRSGKYRSGRNVTGIRFFKPNSSSGTAGSNVDAQGRERVGGVDSNGIASAGEMLVSINDSRIRLCDLDDYSVISKVKGAQNESMQIKASISDDGKYIISGSETGNVYIWNRHYGERVRDKVARNQSYETFSACTNPAATVVAIFAPEAAVKKATQINSGAYILDYIPSLCARIIVTASDNAINVFSRGLAPEHISVDY